MDVEQFRTAAHSAVEDIISYFSNLHTERVLPPVKPGYLRPLLPDSAPVEGEPWNNLLADLSTKIRPGLTHWQHPNFFAFFPVGLSYPSLIGELYSAAFNAPAFNWICSPATTELETVVMDWMRQALGLPECFSSLGEGGGVIQGSASEAIIVAVVAARERYVRAILAKEGLLEAKGESQEQTLKREDRAAEIRGKLVVLGSEQTHSSTAKAAQVLGLRYRSVRAGLETGFSMTGAALRTKVAELDALGLRPFFVTTSIGTTNTCALDDVEGITKFRRERPEIWVHIDAAYAGSALIVPELRDQCQVKYLNEVDSFDVNMHKWMHVNFDASCFFVQKREDLIRALSYTASYLLNPKTLSGQQITDYRDWQLPLGRRFRSLKIWFVLRTYGLKKLQEDIREHIRLGEHFESLCRSPRGQKAGIVVITPAAFALTVIRFIGPAPPDDVLQRQSNGTYQNPQSQLNGFGANGDTAATTTVTHENGSLKQAHDQCPPATPESNALTKEVAERINADGDFFITTTVLDGIDCIRVVGGNLNTNKGSVDALFDTLISTYESVVST